MHTRPGLYRSAKVLVDVRQPDACQAGTYVTPAIFEIGALV